MLDKVELKLKAGDGGRGAVTFRQGEVCALRWSLWRRWW